MYAKEAGHLEQAVSWFKQALVAVSQNEKAVRTGVASLPDGADEAYAATLCNDFSVRLAVHKEANRTSCASFSAHVHDILSTCFQELRASRVAVVAAAIPQARRPARRTDVVGGDKNKAAEIRSATKIEKNTKRNQAKREARKRLKAANANNKENNDMQ
jgi:hypothetical protein